MATVKEIKGEIKECINNNRDNEMEPTIVWDTAKAIMRGNLISRTSYINKMKRLRTPDKQQTDYGEVIAEQMKTAKKRIDNMASKVIKKRNSNSQTNIL